MRDVETYHLGRNHQNKDIENMIVDKIYKMPEKAKEITKKLKLDKFDRMEIDTNWVFGGWE